MIGYRGNYESWTCEYPRFEKFFLQDFKAKIDKSFIT